MTVLTTTAQDMLNSAFASLGSTVVSAINSLVSESNTLINELNTFVDDAGGTISISTSGDSGDFDYVHETVKILPPPTDYAGSQAGYYVGVLAHELGHFMNSIGSFSSMDGPNPFITTELTPASQALRVADKLLGEGIAILNNCLVGGICG
jgi:hypothetical protein